MGSYIICMYYNNRLSTTYGFPIVDNNILIMYAELCMIDMVGRVGYDYE